MVENRIKTLKEMYHPKVRIRLVSMEREPQMPQGLMGKVKHVDDAGQIHVAWNNGSSLALICGVDKFIALEGPTSYEYFLKRFRMNGQTKLWYRRDPNNFTIDAYEAVEIEKLVLEANRFLEKRIAMTQELAMITCYPFNTESTLDVFVSEHIHSDEAVQKLTDKYKFSKDESEAEHCPKCGSEELDYGSLKIEDNFVVYPWTCGKCGSEGKEYGEIVFDGHYVDSSPFFRETENQN